MIGSAKIEMTIGALLATAFWVVIELFCRADSSGLWDFLKLVAQFLGAIAIAYLTVQWALVRFKSEKSWERQTTAYAEAVSSLRDLWRIVETLFQDELKTRNFSAIYLGKLQKRRKKALERFQETAALATVILPDDISDVLLIAEAGLANGYYESRYDELDSEIGIISRALEQLALKKHQYV